MRRLLLPLLLVLALLGAGCMGAAVEPAAQVETPEPLAPGSLLTSTEWSSAGGAFDIGEPVVVPADAGVLLVDYAARYSGRPPTTLQLTATAPDGTAHAIARLGAVALGTRAASGWVILDAQPGEWTFSGSGPGASTGVLNVTVAPLANLTAVVPSGADRVVVAIVDTGINPYHEVFRRDGFATDDLPARIVEAESGAAPLSVPLRRAEDHMATLRADAGVLGALLPGKLVHFEGTNVLGYHVGDAERPAVPVIDRMGHGTAVAHATTNENPDVLVVMITAESYEDAVAWAAGQPWIDILSLSWGPTLNALGVLGGDTPDVTREAYAAGKVVFGASGNDPTPTFTDTTSGPVWVHAVSGSEAAQGARAIDSGNFVDTVANWTQTLALHNSLDATRQTAGTSFATPLTAGVASRILHEARVRSGHEGGIVEGALVKTEAVTLTNKDLRDALNATALWWSATAYKPSDTLPIAPAAPWVSMGWGHVDGSIVPQAVDHFLGVEPAPAKPAAAKAWMDGHVRLRQAMWG